MAFDPKTAVPASTEFDPTTAAPTKTGFGARLGDIGLSLAKGAVAVPEAAVGVADLVTGGKAGKAAESLGFRPKEAKAFLESQKSAAAQDAGRRFQDAEGFTGKLGAAIENPSLIVNAVAESAPLMGAGGLVGRGIMAAATPRAVAGATQAASRIGGGTAAAIGEGVVGAGSAAEAIRQETADGELTGTQSALAAGTGLATGLLGAGGRALAGKFGVGDIDTAITTGSTKVAGQAGKEAPGMLKRVGGGALAEGVFEELPQSVAEQGLQNLALDRPFTQDLDAAAAMGLVTGGAMGAGMGIISSPEAKTPAPGPVAPPAAPPVAPPAAGPSFGAPGKTMLDERALYAAGVNPPAMLDTARVDSLLGDVPPVPVKPSEQMGLNPAAGPLSAAAVTAVDGDATPSMQAAAQATAEQEQATQAQQQADDKLKRGGWTVNEFPVGEEPMVASFENGDNPLFMTQDMAGFGEPFKVRDADWNVIASGTTFEEAAGRAKVQQASGGKAVQPTTGATDGPQAPQAQQAEAQRPEAQPPAAVTAPKAEEAPTGLGAPGAAPTNVSLTNEGKTDAGKPFTMDELGAMFDEAATEATAQDAGATAPTSGDMGNPTSTPETNSAEQPGTTGEGAGASQPTPPNIEARKRNLATLKGRMMAGRGTSKTVAANAFAQSATAENSGNVEGAQSQQPDALTDAPTAGAAPATTEAAPATTGAATPANDGALTNDGTMQAEPGPADQAQGADTEAAAPAPVAAPAPAPASDAESEQDTPSTEAEADAMYDRAVALEKDFPAEAEEIQAELSRDNVAVSAKAMEKRLAELEKKKEAIDQINSDFAIRREQYRRAESEIRTSLLDPANAGRIAEIQAQLDAISNQLPAAYEKLEADIAAVKNGKAPESDDAVDPVPSFTETFDFGGGEITVKASRPIGASAYQDVYGKAGGLLSFDVRGPGVNTESNFRSVAGVPYEGVLTAEMLADMAKSIAQKNSRAKAGAAKATAQDAELAAKEAAKKQNAGRGLVDAMRAVREKKMMEAQRVAAEAEAKASAPAIQAEVFTALVNSPAMIGKVIAEVVDAIKARLAAINATTAMNYIDVQRMARELVKEVKAREAATKKAQAKPVDVYQEALQGAMAGADLADTIEARTAFEGGFAHMLAGKTLSTLTGEGLADMHKGYKAAQAWVEDGDGKAYYEGKRQEKLANTGVDLRRHWESLMAQAKAKQSSIEKLWPEIEKATARAGLFAPYLTENATPALTAYITDLRSAMMTFKDYIAEIETDGGYYQSRNRYAEELKELKSGGRWFAFTNADKFSGDEAYRVAVFQELAQKYITEARKALSFLDGVTTAKEAAKKFSEMYVDPKLEANTTNSRIRAIFNEAGLAQLVSSGARTYSSGAKLAGVDDLKIGLFSSNTAFSFAAFRDGSEYLEKLTKDENDPTHAPESNRSKPLTQPRLDKVTRTSKDTREGKDVSPKEFKERFGFADVGFGSWVGAKEDQDHLNYAWDAFTDLADHMGIDYKNIGFGGRLHFTIGALGRGKASAHFHASQPSPGGGMVSVINLTNTKGDGTVYHEWIHALDHFLQADRGWGGVRYEMLTFLKQTVPTERSIEIRAMDFIKGQRWMKGSKTQPKLDSMMDGMRYYLRNPDRLSYTTTYKANADSLGASYWGNDAELLARAGEAWAVDTLKGTNTYLVNPAWAGDGAVTPAKGYRGTPYPMGEERKTFAQVYGAMKAALTFDASGKPKLDKAKFESTLPDEMTAAKRLLETLTVRETAEKWVEQQLKIQESEKEMQEEERRAKEREEQEEMDRLAAEAAKNLPPVDPPKPSDAQGPLSMDELSDIFDQALAEVMEDGQEKPEVPLPGQTEPPAPKPVRSADGAPTPDDARELMAKVEAGGMVIFAGSDWASTLPNIHNMGNVGDVRHMGMGVFKFEGKDFSGTYDAGGAMNQTAGGTAYSMFSITKGQWEYPKARVLEKLKEAAGKEEKPAPKKEEKKAPTQADKTAAALISEAAKLGVKGAGEALTGLAKLFGGGPGRLNSFPAGFDEDAYKQAKPHFKAALASFQEAGKTLKDLFTMLVRVMGPGVKMYATQFAYDEGLTNTLGQAKADSPKSPSTQVADKVVAAIESNTAFDWRQLFAWADDAFGGTQAEGKYQPKDAYDAVEAGVNRYIQSNPQAFTPQQDFETAAATVARLEQITKLLPTQTKRTEEQDEFQQYSTVPALAFTANWAANVTAADTYMEPSAGIGGLASFGHTAGAKLVLNELSARRAAVLQDVFPASKVFTENAEQLHNVLPDSVQPTVVVMNPPFSASAGRIPGMRNTKIGAQHVEQALKRLEPNGRLVAIVGEGMAMDKPAFREWWAGIQKEYDVRAVIPMDGSGYAKYGTTFDNVVLVIDKKAPSGRKVVTTPAKTYTELLGLLTEIRNDRPATNPATQQPATDSVTRDDAESGRRNAADSEQSGGGGNTGGAPGLLGDGAAGQRTGGRGNAAGGGRSGGTNTGGNRRNGGGSGSSAGANAGGNGNNPASVPGGQSESELSVNAAEPTKAGELTDSVFENYRPQRLEIPGSVTHPGALVQSSAMASVLPPAPTYTPNLPAATITDGKLSDAQLESVVYAGQAHQESIGKTEKGVDIRRGFFIGDGTGVGKGREISGIMLDNLRQGRTKGVWITEKQGLIKDAKRDFGGVGGDPEIIFNQSDMKNANAPIKEQDGIVFTTYSTLRSEAQSGGDFKKGADVRVSAPGYGGAKLVKVNSKKSQVTIEANGTKTVLPFFQILSIGGDTGWMAAARGMPKTRLQQLVEWLGPDYDGVIAFDEAHNAGNAIEMKAARGKSKPSAQALAVVALQEALPKARVVYVSATGATEVSNLSFATRLGLWGTGTPFPTVQSFIAEMTAGGLSTMELVARDMKQMGAYLARSLSYEGVTYSRVEHELTPLQRDQYDRLSDAWQVVLRDINKALDLTDGSNGKAKGNAMSAFWGAQQRFFNQIITSMQMPSVIEQMEKDIAAGDALVLQLVNTNEAQQERALAEAKSKADDGEDADIEELDLTPRDMLLEMVRKSFPVIQYVSTVDSNGNTQWVPAQDSKGDPIENRDAVKMRDKLLQDLEQIKVPDGPLEYILNTFGPEVVAEVTGRSKRVVRVRDEDGNLVAKIEKRGGSANEADAEAFMADKKRVLVFSNAGGTGYSFHADKTKQNQRKRKHYLIQPGWQANKAVQGFGRSHRTNSASVPHYYLASTNIPAQKRFLSAIARRLDQLGALTKGQRDTASQGMFSERDNLESEYATRAVRQFFMDLLAGKIDGLTFARYAREAGLEDMLDENNAIVDSKVPSTPKFLNRMLSLNLATQDIAFEAFLDRMDEQIAQAAANGELDSGMQTIKALETRVTDDTVAYTDKRTGADTRLVELELTQPTRKEPFPREADLNKGKFMVRAGNGRVFYVREMGTITDKNGRIVPRYRLSGTSGPDYKKDTDYAGGFDKAFSEIDPNAAEAAWVKENEQKPDTYTIKRHMIVGAVLPIWDRIKSGTGVIKVGRTQTVDGQRLLGIMVPEKDLEDIRKRLNVTSPAAKMPVSELMREVLTGKVVTLANNWRLQRSKVSDELRIEVLGAGSTMGGMRELRDMGAIIEQIQWQQRIFVPLGKSGVDMLTKMFESKPVISLTDPNAKTQEPDGPSAFSRTRPVFSRAAQGQASSMVQGIVDTIKARWENAPKVVVAFDMNDPAIPEAVRKEDQRQRSGGATGTPEGFYYKGTVYLMSSKLATPGDVVRVLFHEALGHYGLRGVFGKELKPILQQIATMRKSQIEAKMKEYGLRGVSSMDRLVAAEEILAEMAQTSPQIGFVRRAVAAVKAWLRKHIPGFGKMMLTDDEIITQFILPARNFVVNGGPNGSGNGRGTRFQRTADSVPTQSFKKSPLGLYSALGRSVSGLVVNSASAQSWKDAIKGLVNKGAAKADEVEWSGVNEWLDMQPGKVTKQQIADYLANDGVQVQETVLGGDRNFFDEDTGEEYPTSQNESQPKYSQYTLPGGENYREVLLTLPMNKADAPKGEIKYDPAGDAQYPWAIIVNGKEENRSASKETAPDILQEELERVAKRSGYRSSHWDQRNILAHIRVNDRTDENGNKVLFVEEVQSDWGQEGKKKGFVQPVPNMAIKVTGEDLTVAQLLEREGAQGQDWLEGRNEMRKDMNEPPLKEGDMLRSLFENGKRVMLTDRVARPLSAAIGERQARVNAMVKNAEREAAAKNAGKTQPAPFVTKTDGWLNLAMKRIITMAVEGGYDKVAFVNGEQSADRFGLDKRLDSIQWAPSSKANRTTIVIMPKDGGQTSATFDTTTGVFPQFESAAFGGNRLDDVLGKEIAEKIMASPEGELSGDGLKVEAKGMRAFYDSIVPNTAKKLIGKMGGEMERIEFDTRNPEDESWYNEPTDADFITQTGFTITPKMREQVGGEGLPMFSRSMGEALTAGVNNVRDMKLPAGYMVNDFMKSSGKLGWWHKTVGTQYDLAQRNPLFKRVFDSAQGFLNDVSFHASEAANEAPTLLPKLETLKDLGKQAISATDNKAIATPIFEGTLLWTRTEDGRAIRMEERDIDDDELTPGVVFTPQELRDNFDLSGELGEDGKWSGQIGLYQEFRASVDKSLTSMGLSDMVRLGGSDLEAVADQVMEARNFGEALEIASTQLRAVARGEPRRAAVLLDTIAKLAQKVNRYQGLIDKGYAPLSRFGQKTLDVVDTDGKRVYFGLFENESEANKMARQMAANYPGATITQGTTSEEKHKLFAGVSPETLELFGEMIGLEGTGNQEADIAFQQYLKVAKANRSAMKRMIHRKGIAGFSEDPGRVLAGFVYSNARQTASAINMGELTKAVAAIPKEQGELADHAVRLRNYVSNPTEEAQAFRGLLFAQYIGGSVASAIINMTQPFAVTVPWLSQFGGARNAGKQMLAAAKDAIKGTTGDEALDRALKKAAEDGIVSPQEVFQLQAQAAGRATLKAGDGTKMGDALATSSNALSKLGIAWGQLFGLAEQFNRRAAFIAAYRTAVAQGMADPAAFAERAINETQFIYSKANKPRWARGAVGSVLFTFKQYSVSYVELMARMATSGKEGRKAALLGLAILFMLSGAGGLPFAEDVDDLIDGIMQRLGYNFSSKQAKQEFFAGILGEDGAKFMMRGISGVAGVPVDVSGRFGMGNLIPSTGLLTKKTDYTRDVVEIFGPAGDLVPRMLQAGEKLVQGEVLGARGALATAAPLAGQNLVKAMEMANTGMYLDKKGRKVLDVDGWDALSKAVGFQPNQIAEVQDAAFDQQRMIGVNRMREAEISDKWARGLFLKDKEMVDEARESLAEWNANNPDTPIRIKMPQILRRLREMNLSKTERVAKAAPQEVRARVREELGMP